MPLVMRLRTASRSRSHARTAISAGVDHVRDEDGALLIELIVTAALLVVVILGTFSAFDGASASSSTIKNRALAAGIAQQDQERLRTFKSTDLSNYRETRTQVVAGVPYTVVSRADWVVDSTGGTSCGPAGANAQANYVEITSTVTWPVMRNVQPVVQKSYVAPPNGSFGANQGSLCVQVIDGSNAPLPGLTVSTTGAGTYSDVTDTGGSTFFGYIPTGNYTVTVGSSCIDENGNSPPTKQVSVVGATTTTLTVLCAQPAQITGVTFDTKPFINSVLPLQLGATVASRNKWGFSIGHPSLPAPAFRKFTEAQSMSGGAITGLNGPFATPNNIFPFSSPYSIWAGNCLAMKPSANGTDPDPTVLATAGGSVSPAAALHQPALNILAISSVPLSTPVVGARVRVTPSQPEMNGCAGTISLGNTNIRGELDEPGLPYGTYDVCVDKPPVALSVTVSKVKVSKWPGTNLIQFPLVAGVASPSVCP
jgi:Flp pilus assembly pilin Flp